MTGACRGNGRKIAIIGKAPSSVFKAPYDDPSWEIWILNTLGVLHEVPRWDCQFELHDIELTKDKAYGNYYEWLREQSFGSRPVILRDVIPEDFGPIARPFPLTTLRQELGYLAGINYITNTVSWMIALALLEHVQASGDGQEGITDIGLWGVDMAQHGLAWGHAGGFTSEYAKQRPSCEYWAGVCEGMGIRLHIPAESDLLKTACLYGYHTDELWRKRNARRNELTQRVQQAQARENQAHDEAVFLSGALEALNYESQSWGSAPEKL